MGLGAKLSLYGQASGGQFRTAGGARVNDFGVKFGATGSVGNGTLDVNGTYGSSIGTSAKLSYKIPLSENSGIETSAQFSLLKEQRDSYYYDNMTEPKTIDINTASQAEIQSELKLVQKDQQAYLSQHLTEFNRETWADSDLSYSIGAEYYHNFNNITLRGGMRYEKSTAFATPTYVPEGRDSGKSWKFTTSVSTTPFADKSIEIFGGASKDLTGHKNLEGLIGIRKSFNIFGK